MPEYRFNCPPGWPVPPPGWKPSREWKPDPSWPPAPAGWEFWVLEETPAPAASVRQPPERKGGGLFGGKKRLEEENSELHLWVERLGGMDAMRIAAMTEALHVEHAGLQVAISDATRRLREMEARVVQTEETVLLQEMGVYEYRHPLSDAVAYKDRLSEVKASIKQMAREGRAVVRRLEPEDRVRELGDASVPFRFDTHALIFSEDAVELEARLHAELSDRRLNKVNLRREFFHATPAEVRDLLQKIAGQHLLEYRDTAEALEWRQSVGALQNSSPT